MLFEALSPTLSPTFHALSDPTRRYYLQCLVGGQMRLMAFYELFSIRESTVMHHLGVLEKSGLVLSRKQGPMRLYTLRPERLQEADKWLRWLAARC